MKPVNCADANRAMSEWAAAARMCTSAEQMLLVTTPTLRASGQLIQVAIETLVDGRVQVSDAAETVGLLEQAGYDPSTDGAQRVSSGPPTSSSAPSMTTRSLSSVLGMSSGS